MTSSLSHPGEQTKFTKREVQCNMQNPVIKFNKYYSVSSSFSVSDAESGMEEDNRTSILDMENNALCL